MKVKIENTIKKINDAIESTVAPLDSREVMQLSQSALNLAQTASILDGLQDLHLGERT